MRISQTVAAAKVQWPKRRAKSFENAIINGYRLAMENEGSRPSTSAERWTKRVGTAAFLFFLIKGLLWLIVPAIVTYFALK
jgi:hypothetical protein